MKEGSKPEYPEKTPGDELQKSQTLSVWISGQSMKGQPSGAS